MAITAASAVPSGAGRRCPQQLPGGGHAVREVLRRRRPCQQLHDHRSDQRHRLLVHGHGRECGRFLDAHPGLGAVARRSSTGPTPDPHRHCHRQRRGGAGLGAPADFGLAISGYEVVANGAVVCRSTTPTCTVTGLTVGKKYAFTVTAINEAGRSINSGGSNLVVIR